MSFLEQIQEEDSSDPNSHNSKGDEEAKPLFQDKLIPKEQPKKKKAKTDGMEVMEEEKKEVSASSEFKES